MNILPQYQGDYYTLQNKQALAQALMQQSMQGQPLPQTVGSGGSQNYQVMPKYSMGAGIAQLGQALLAAKLQQQTAQGYQGLGQNQMNFLMGGQQASPAASGTGGSPDGTTASAGPAQADPQALAGALAASGGGTAPQQAQAQPQQAQGGGGLLAPGSVMNPSGMDVGKAAFLYQTMGPEAYAKEFVAPYVKPTDATLMARQGGVDQGAANRGALLKNNYVAPVVASPNSTVISQTGGGSSTLPAAAPAGYQNIQSTDGKWYTIPVQGGTQAVAGSAAAQAGGEGSQLPYDKAVDANGNPLPITNRTAVANQAGATTPASAAIVQTESSGNQNAVSPKGALGAWQVMPNTKTNPGFGVTPAENNSPAELNRVGKDYYNAMTQRYGSPTVGAIAYNMGPGATDTWLKNGAQFEKLPQETQNYVGKVATLTALNSGAGTPQGASGSPIYAAAPMGAQANVEANVKGQVDTMQKSYQNLQTVRSGAPAALQDLGNMQNLASGKSSAIIGPGMASMAGLVSANAAEYEKSRDNLVTNLGSQLGINSDAAREMVYGSIPSYGAPKQAIANGLQTLQGQVQTRLLKAGYLTDAYTAGDAKAYNQKENQFDQNITPAIANVVTQPPGPQRSAALAAAAKDPQVRARLEWAAQNGVLK
jgi:soluble lytic murein transglycosylase-like protein